MKSMRSARVLAGLALIAAFAMGSGAAVAQSPTPAPAKIGSSLIGRLEGPEIILDAKAFPKSFKEAPILDAQVKAGKLPPVDKRLPEPSQLFVVKPLHEIGKYGGNWRRAFTGPADHENRNQINSLDKILTFDYTGTKIIPSLARDWKVSDDGKTTTIFLRKGARWSDGTPFTANDFMFWYQEIYLNKNINPTPFFEFQINGKDGVMKKIDDSTVAFEFPEPYPFFVSQLAGSTAIGGGFATRGGFQNFGGAYAPAHYLKQFLPKYSSEEAVTKKGNYTVHLDPALNGSDATIHIGNSYEGDPEIAKLLKNKDFRHALSLGIDRDQLNEAFWLGVGTPGSIAPAPDTIYSPGPEWNKKYATLDVKQANELLDKVGLSKKDGEGYRLRTDGKGRLRLELVTVGGQFVPYTPVGEMIKQQWKKIGIDLDVKELERNLAFTRDNGNENQMITWANDGSEMIYLFPRHALPVDAAEAHMGMA